MIPFIRWLLPCLLAASSAAAGPRDPTDQIRAERRNDVLELKWSDAEDRLQGSIAPAQPREGEPVTLSLHVGTFEGADFDGPLTVTFQKEGAPAEAPRTLTKGKVNWHTEWVPASDGNWQVEVRFRSTHLKVLNARVSVIPSSVPRLTGWILIAVLAVIALGLGVRALVQRDRPSPPEAQEPATPGAAPAREAAAPTPVAPADPVADPTSGR